MEVSWCEANPMFAQAIKCVLKVTVPTLVFTIPMSHLRKFVLNYQSFAKNTEEMLPEDCAENPEKYLKKGDILSRPLMGVCRHTAVYMGKGEVIHISGGTKYEKVQKILQREKLLDNFAKKGVIFYRVKFHSQIRTGKQVANAAKEVLTENWEYYNLLMNNCQHFATYCALGEKRVVEKKGLVIYIETFVLNAGLSCLTNSFMEQLLHRWTRIASNDTYENLFVAKEIIVHFFAPAILICFYLFTSQNLSIEQPKMTIFHTYLQIASTAVDLLLYATNPSAARFSLATHLWGLGKVFLKKYCL